MLTNLKAIYEGNGILRLLDVPPELVEQQEVQIFFYPPSEFDLEEPYQPSAEAIWRDVGMLRIGDAEVARWVAESPELYEWNQSSDEESD